MKYLSFVLLLLLVSSSVVSWKWSNNVPKAAQKMLKKPVVKKIVKKASKAAVSKFEQEIDQYTSAPAESSFCWKKSYGRGVGRLPKDCGANKEYDAGLCYKLCPKGYRGIGPVCWKGWKPKGRGVGKIPKACLDDKQYQAGLCYPPCDEDFKGVGPVCWKMCTGRNSYDCGLSCAESGKTCLMSVFNMVKSVLMMIKDIATMIMSAGINPKMIAQNPQAAVKSMMAAAKAFAKKGLPKQTYFKFIKEKASQIGSAVSEDTLQKLWNGSKMDKARTALELVATIDPTGITNVVLAFLHDTC